MSTHFDSYLDHEENEIRKIKSNTWWQLLREIFRHRKYLILGCFAILIGTCAALAEPRLFGYAIDEAIIPRRGDLLTRFTLIFFCVIVIRMVSTISQGYLFEILGQKVTQELRCQLFSHVQRLQMHDLDRNPAGKLLTRVTNDVATLGEMFSGGIVSMFSNALMVIGILAWLFVLDTRLGLIASSVFPFLVAASVYFSLKLKASYREARTKLSALNAFLAENLLGMRVVHLFNRKSLHMSRFERLNQWYSDAQIDTVRVFAVFQPTITLSAGISVALVIWFGGKAAQMEEIKIGVLFAYFSYVLSLFQPIRELADKWNVFLSGLASAERIFSILDWPVESDSSSPESRQDLKGHIVFDHVWFSYHHAPAEQLDGHERWTLKDFSLEILPGQKVGIVGHTGAGKSTLMSLLMRFYEPQRGRILLDGRDIREYDRRALRASIGIVQQDVFIFSGSFKDNITFWGSVSDDALLSQEIGSASLSDPHRMLQEKGSNLSMGEKQVLAFARAHAADPAIWVLDEATANMDSETERAVQKTLDTASAGKTVIFIAHRLATVKNCDLIIVLHKGNVVEKGTHGDLVAANGLYARLNRLQESEDNRLSPVMEPISLLAPQRSEGLIQ